MCANAAAEKKQQQKILTKHFFQIVSFILCFSCLYLTSFKIIKNN
jgi:hypothetical protein